MQEGGGSVRRVTVTNCHTFFFLRCYHSVIFLPPVYHQLSVLLSHSAFVSLQQKNVILYSN